MRNPLSARRRAAAFAALITAGAVTAGDLAARTFPFGPRTRSVNDLGNQFVPFHARLWDLLHGRTDGGLLLDWQSGYGSNALTDLGTYLTSPFSVLVALFPRDGIDLAVYVVTLVKTAVAAAAMTWLLTALHKGRGRRWAAGVLGASYALCGWSVTEASYNPMWLDGLIAFPLLCLTAEWARTGRRPLLGPVLVALAWTANFYTAYMAVLGAALVLTARLLLDGTSGRERTRALLRATRTVLLGTGLAAPVLIPVYLGSTHAYPGWTKEFTPASWTDVLARTLPATYSFFTPAVFTGGATLLLALALAFHRAVPRRERLVWTVLTAAVALSLQWGPTHLLWHAFATPNGSPYRQTFVLAGIAVIAAWTCLSRGWPDRRALAGGTAAVLVLALGATGSELARREAYLLLAAGLAAAVAGLVLAARGRAVAVAAVLLTAAVAGQAAATTAYADRERPLRLDHYPPWGADHDARAAAVAAADGWPAYRTDPGRTQLTANDALLLGGQGGAYYSSHTADVWTRTLSALGGGWTSRGRSLQSLDNPVTDAVFSVGARIRSAPGGEPRTVRREVPPLVTVRPGGGEQAYGDSPFRNQELLLGARVYEPAADGACRAGTEVFLWAPDWTGTARLGDNPPQRLLGGQPKRRAALTPLGTAHTAGERVTYRGEAPRDAEIGCLDPARLSAAVDALRRTGAVSVEVSANGVTAEMPPGSTGVAVIAAPRIAGWSCGGRPADAYLGLVAVPLDGSRTTVSCSFRPPGVLAGAAVGLMALLGVVATVLVTRRTGRGPAGPGHAPGGPAARGAVRAAVRA
ncbi:YfhO family protein [Streptomyces genisteinicus]|uniref:YfhO family protein n=1 Tax=Streptomyces genisteinicus TaxID=2768068 RepID=A0A7H0HT23_9ACTN|nr:YfhO family protein [Streptomyces genisteinicus]QNP63689.1 YfhO family protein [Streptomyces genisteinicus]